MRSRARIRSLAFIALLAGSLRRSQPLFPIGFTHSEEASSKLRYKIVRESGGSPLATVCFAIAQATPEHYESRLRFTLVRTASTAQTCFVCMKTLVEISGGARARESSTLSAAGIT